MDVLSCYLSKTQSISAEVWFHFPTIVYYIIGLDEKIETEEAEFLTTNQKTVYRNLREVRVEDATTILGPLRLYILKGREVFMAGGKDYFGEGMFDLVIRFALTIYNKYCFV